MGGERTHVMREDTWEERGHMEGERTHGRREDTWEERGHMGGERTHGREDIWGGRGHTCMGGEKAPPSPLLPHHCQVLIAALRTIYP